MLPLILTIALALPPLPEQTSPYNRGDTPGRYRDGNRRIRLFELKRPAPLLDGGGREIGTVDKPVMLNVGAVKTINGKSHAWAWATPAGSGWIARDALVDPPAEDVDPTRNPKPPAESDKLLTIDAAGGREKLKGMVHPNSRGELLQSGNRGEHYAGRNPGASDYVYLLFACPNVQRGGTAKDSLPDGSRFVPALDERGKPISEVMTMYRDGDVRQPVRVAFIYGRGEDGEMYGWLARANVGAR